MMETRLSIIIVSWNVQQELLDCLRSIGDHPPFGPYEVIVVDNASTDGTIETVRREFASVRVVANTENRGFSAGNNAGIKESKGEYVLLLNPDTVVHPGALDTLTQFLEENADVAACGPRLLDGDGHNCCSVGAVPTFRGILYRSTPFRWLGIFRGHYNRLSREGPGYDRVAHVEQLSGAALLIRRSVLEQIGLLDERFFMYYEDVDLCLRITAAGWRIAFVPSATITHLGGRSAAQVSARKRMLLYASLLTYLRKHRGRLSTTLFNLAFKPGVILKELGHVFSGSVVFGVSLLLFDRRRQLKAQAKVKDSAMFLGQYGLFFLLKA